MATGWTMSSDSIGEPRCLLILGCSQSKRADEGWIPAWDRYTGPAWLVLRKAQREGRAPRLLDVCALSAQFGLLHAAMKIPNYDLRMTAVLARELAEQTADRLDFLLLPGEYQSIFVNLGATYLLAVAGSQRLAEESASGRVVYASGGIGQRLAQQKRWLEESAAATMGKETKTGGGHEDVR